MLPENILTMEAVASAMPSMRPTVSALAPSTETMNTGRRLWIISGRELPAMDAFGLLPTGWRLRIPRPAAGRHGPHVLGTGHHEGASPPSRGPTVCGRGRPALVARAERSGNSHALLGRPAGAFSPPGAPRPRRRG